MIITHDVGMFNISQGNFYCILIYFFIKICFCNGFCTVYQFYKFTLKLRKKNLHCFELKKTSQLILKKLNTSIFNFSRKVSCKACIGLFQFYHLHQKMILQFVEIQKTSQEKLVLTTYHILHA